MAVARKPKPQSLPSPTVDIDALINKGGSVASSGPSSSGASDPSPIDQSPVQVNLRVPPALLQQIDQALGARPFKTPRQTWILEAVLEKLKRELGQ